MATWPSIAQFNNLTSRVSSLEGGGNAAASAGVAVLKSFPSQDPGGYVALSNIGVETLALVPIRQITIALAADRTLPYVLQEIHIYNPESAPQGVQIRYLDTNRNRSEGEGTYPSFTHYTLNTHSGQMTSNFDGSRLILGFPRPVVIKPGGELTIDFTGGDDPGIIATLPVMASTAPAEDAVATANGLTTTLHDVNDQPIGGKYVEISGVVYQRSVYGSVFSDMFPVVLTPTPSLIGFEIVDNGAEAATLRYRNAQGTVTEWPGVLGAAPGGGAS